MALGPEGARHRQGPSGIDAEVKRSRLSQKKIRPQPAFDGLEAAGGFWGGGGRHQGPSGIDTGVKRNHLSKKKIRPRPAFDGLWRPPEAIIKEGSPIFELVLP